jgi:hypothetical protein
MLDLPQNATRATLGLEVQGGHLVRDDGAGVFLCCSPSHVSFYSLSFLLPEKLNSFATLLCSIIFWWREPLYGAQTASLSRQTLYRFLARASLDKVCWLPRKLAGGLRYYVRLC